MKKIIILLSHKLQDVQLQELSTKDLQPVYLNEELQKQFSNVPPEFDSNQVHNLATPILNFISEEDIGFGIIGGELSLTYNIISRSKNVMWFTATTKRISKDVVNPDGTTTKTSVFEHCKFRPIQ